MSDPRIIPLKSVYHHPQVSEQNESISIVASISMGGWSMHFIAPMDFLDISTIALFTHFGLKYEALPVDDAIEECLSEPPSV